MPNREAAETILKFSGVTWPGSNPQPIHNLRVDTHHWSTELRIPGFEAFLPLKEKLQKVTGPAVKVAQSEDDDEAFAAMDTASAASFNRFCCRPGL